MGERLFDVRVNGTLALDNFDIRAAAGALNKAVVREVTATTNAQGEIVIDFDYVNNDPLISGIELISGGLVVQTIDSGNEPVGRIRVVGSTEFRNEGSLQVADGSTLEVTGLTGNVGDVVLSGAG